MTEFTDKFDIVNSDPLDRQIDGALAKYASVEPRTGLEERILANLKARERSSIGIAWWRWAGVLAAAVIVTALLIWKLEKPRREPVARHPAVSHDQYVPQVAVNTPATKLDRPPAAVFSRHAHRRVLRHAIEVAAEPRLDRFPSPQPLSEEELALARYVRAFPEEATLIARAQEEYEKEIQQSMKGPASGTGLSDSEQEER